MSAALTDEALAVLVDKARRVGWSDEDLTAAIMSVVTAEHCPVPVIRASLDQPGKVSLRDVASFLGADHDRVCDLFRTEAERAIAAGEDGISRRRR